MGMSRSWGPLGWSRNTTAGYQAPPAEGPAVQPSAASALSALSGFKEEDDLFRDPFADFAPSGR